MLQPWHEILCMQWIVLHLYSLWFSNFLLLVHFGSKQQLRFCVFHQVWSPHSLLLSDYILLLLLTIIILFYCILESFMCHTTLRICRSLVLFPKMMTFLNVVYSKQVIRYSWYKKQASFLKIFLMALELSSQSLSPAVNFVYLQ